MSSVTNNPKLRLLIAVIPFVVILIVACGKSEVPSLIEAPTVTTPTPKVVTVIEELVNEPVQSDSNGQPDNEFDTKEIERNYRGINDETIKTINYLFKNGLMHYMSNTYSMNQLFSY